MSVAALVFFVLAGGLGALAAVRISDSRRRASLPPGVLHAVTASLLIDELAAADQFRPALTGVRRRRLRMFGLGRVAGRLDITADRITWAPGRVARWGRMPTLEVPLAGVASIEVVSAAFPIDYAGIEVRLADGRRLAIETRGAARLRASFARTVVADDHRLVDPFAQPQWGGTTPDPTGPPSKPRLSKAKAYGLLAGWVGLFALTLGPLGGDESAKTNLLVDVGAVVFFLAALAAIGFLLVRSPPRPHVEHRRRRRRRGRLDRRPVRRRVARRDRDRRLHRCPGPDAPPPGRRTHRTARRPADPRALATLAAAPRRVR